MIFRASCTDWVTDEGAIGLDAFNYSNELCSYWWSVHHLLALVTRWWVFHPAVITAPVKLLPAAISKHPVTHCHHPLSYLPHLYPLWLLWRLLTLRCLLLHLPLIAYAAHWQPIPAVSPFGWIR